MKASERLRATMGANIAESIETDRPVSRVTPAAAQVPVNRYAGLDRVKGAVLIPVDQLEPDPDQPRKEFDADGLARLAGSLKERGQLVPIQVRWDTNRWVIVAGERRWRAARLASMEKLKCVEVEGELSADDRVRLQLIENCVREDLKPVEQARAFEALMLHGRLTQQELADQLHVSQGTVSRALALLRLPEDIQEQVDAGVIPAQAGYQIAKTADPTERAVMAEEVRAKVARREPAGRRPRPVRLEVPGGRVTIDLGTPDPSADDLLAALDAARKKIRSLKQGAAA